MKRRYLLAFVALLGGSCSAPPQADDAIVASAASERRSSGSTDPVDHLQVIAGPEMEGRATPSRGLDLATDYVVGECVHAGLSGGVGGGYKQPFTVASQTANNVVAVLPGSGPHNDEIVLLAAHLDHLGPGFPGADDNGSGSAALVAIAHRLVASRTTHPLDRSVGFLWTVGEERGLLGSAHFTANPPPALPLTRIVQVINLDAIGALEDNRFSILPDESANTKATVAVIAQASREMDPPFTRINHDLEAYTRRTDAYSFVRHHVPTIWVSEGLTNPLGGGPLMPRYHRRTDTVENLLVENGGSKIRRMTTMLTITVETIANTTFERFDVPKN
jgi:aminopeptidase YwaD